MYLFQCQIDKSVKINHQYTLFYKFMIKLIISLRTLDNGS
jgi:hypothetical protein